MTPWTVSCQAPLSMGFSRQEYWSELPFPSPEYKTLLFVQSLSRFQLFGTWRTAACQTSLSFTISWRLFKLMSIQSMMPSNHLILYHPLLLPSIFPSIGSFLVSRLFDSGCESIGASASVLPMNIQDWFPLGLTGLILQSKGLWRVFSNTTVQKHQNLG